MGFVNPLFSQNFEVQVKDFKTKDPIPYAVMLFGKEGSAADANGKAILEIRAGFRGEIHVKALGYRDTIIPATLLKPVPAKNIFLLQQQNHQLQEVVIKPGKVIQVGHNKENPILNSRCHLKPGYQVGLLMKTPYKETAFLKDVSFYITHHGNLAPFRIRIYEISEDGLPGKDILTQTLLFSPHKRRSWNSVNIQEYEILVPENGLIVAAEWIFTDSSYYLIDSAGNLKYGASIGLGYDKSFADYYMYYLNDKWRKENWSAYTRKSPTPMIRASVITAK